MREIRVIRGCFAVAALCERLMNSSGGDRPPLQNPFPRFNVLTL